MNKHTSLEIENLLVVHQIHHKLLQQKFHLSLQLHIMLIVDQQQLQMWLLFLHLHLDHHLLF